MFVTTEPLRWLGAALIVCLWAGWCAWVLRRAARRPELAPAEGDADGSFLLLFASQTGAAAAIAEYTADRLRAVGRLAGIARLGSVSPAQLAGVRRALFIVSTCGEGDPPDDAYAFVRAMQAPEARLDGLEFSLLALGDRSYRSFCAFGQRLDDWLRDRGARPIAGRIEVDAGDPAALQRWSELVGGLAGQSAGDPIALPGAAPAEPWRLTARSTMNPGSSGEPILNLRFEPADGQALAPDAWQAGDLVRLQIPGDPPETRDYSIASLPSEGAVELFVRLRRDTAGRPGRASGWLAGVQSPEPLQPGDCVMLGFLANSGFRLQGPPGQALILIGAGSGFAGLRALLKARAETPGAGPVWLVFGERSAEHDFLRRAELERWHSEGVLARLDAVFSRDASADTDGGSRRYVQHLLREQAQQVRQWIGDGAAVHVCGSRQRLAVGVDAALAEILGEAEFDRLRASNRYRRDIW